VFYFRNREEFFLLAACRRYQALHGPRRAAAVGPYTACGLTDR